MFEEVNHNFSIVSSKARFNACAKQCRIQKFMSGGTIFDGNCTCDRPIECKFGLQDKLDAIEPTEYFPDVVEYWRQLVLE